MDSLSLVAKAEAKSDLPIRALQFGEGNFLRGFIDWMIFKANQQGLFNGRVLALQCTPRGRVVPKLKAQDGLYTTILHGVDESGAPHEEIEVINTIAEALNPYENWEQVLAAAMNPELKFVFSNTTEAGITYAPEQAFNTDVCPETYPGKLSAILHERFKAGLPGLWVVPCELLDNNGTLLREIVLKHADDQQLGAEFKQYVTAQCRFINTLVDRVVSGYPKDNAAEVETKLGYKDELMTCGETFHFLALEGDEEVSAQLPFAQAGLNVVVAADITPYRLRKVRILNGTHTANVPAAFLAGLDTVDQMMAHEVTGKFARSVIYDEIIPAVNLDRSMLVSFADDVVKRFSDPAMHHQLASILMNSTSKIKARVLPTVLDARAKGILPKKLCFALAAYIALYYGSSGVPVKVSRAQGKLGEFMDDAYAAEVMTKAWSVYQKTEASALFTVKTVLSDTKLWDCDLSSDVDLTALVARLLHAIISDGVIATMQDLLEHN
ncbi:MAG TPA: tagaturonate reductase [Candidatus Anaerobiospirillum stercoravium]|nr:tagaturonate reductase [Candidatus Anaerobiospirillum stercoravium]